MDTSRVTQLISHYLDEDITDEELAELEQLIKRHPEAADMFAELVTQHSVMRRAVEMNQLEETEVDDDKARSDTTPPPAADLMSRRNIIAAGTFMAVAAAVILAVLLNGQSETPPAPDPDPDNATDLAVLTPVEVPPGLVVKRLDGAMGIWRHESKVWRPVLQGELLATAASLRVSATGRAELTHPGAQLVLGPGSRITPLGSDGQLNELKFERGSVRVITAVDAEPLSINTPLGQVRLSAGTEAALALADDDGSVRLVRGNASLRSPDGQGLSLKAGPTVALASRAVPVSIPDEVFKAPEVDATSSGLGKLLIKDTLGREQAPLEIRELRVFGTVEDAVALTEIEQTFYNPTDRQAEGTFYFPLPAGASISRFAMFVEDQLVEGELVERVRARQVYEEIVRKMQDPALMEWQEGNIFKTRIFPIPAKGLKRIIVHYTQVLPIIDGRRRYVFPLVSKTTQIAAVDSLEIDIRLSGLLQGGELSVPAYPGATIDRNGASANVRMVEKDFHPHYDFVLYAQPDRTQPLDLYADRGKEEDGFLMLSYIADGGGTTLERTPRDTIYVLDTSLSRRADDYRAQLDVLRTFMVENMRGDRIALMTFDVAARLHHTGFIDATAANVDAALDMAREVVPLGGTDLAVAFDSIDSYLATHTPRGRPDVVMISDGIGTIGETATSKLLARIRPILEKHNARFHAVAMGARYDHLLLQELVRRTGGLFRAMSPGTPVAEEAFEMALAMDSLLLPAPDINFAGGNVKSVYPKTMRTLVAGEELILLGRYDRSEHVNVTVSDTASTIASGEFYLPEAADDSVFVPRLWAREKLDALLMEDQSSKVKAQVVQLSQEFTLITPYTSFLVLENEKMYKDYGIDRAKRRRYWESAGRLKSEPPPGARTAPSEEDVPTEVPGSERPTVSETSFRELLLGRPPIDSVGSGELWVAHGPMRRRPGKGEADMKSPAAWPGGAREPGDPQSAPVADDEAMPLEEERTAASASAVIGGEGGPGQGGGGMYDFDSFDLLATPGLAAPEERAELDQQAGPAPAPAGSPVPALAVTEESEVRMQFMLDEKASKSLNNMKDSIWGRSRTAIRISPHQRDALKRLAAAQNADGSWPEQGTGTAVRATANAVLSMYHFGHSEKSKEYGKAVTAALKWLETQEASDVHDMALCARAAALAFAHSGNHASRNSARKSLERLAGAQLQRDGKPWGWGLAGKVDLSATLQAVQTLRFAQAMGLKVAKPPLSGAKAYLDYLASTNGTIMMPDDQGRLDLAKTIRIAAGRVLAGAPKNDKRLATAANAILDHLSAMPWTAGSSLAIPAGVVMRHIGGKHLNRWKAWLRVEIAMRPPELWENFPLESATDEAGIRKMIAAVRDAQGDEGQKALNDLTNALGQTNDATLLVRLAAEEQAPLIRQLLQVRLGMAHILADEFAQAAEAFRTAYEGGGFVERVLQYYVYALRRDGQSRPALDYLIARWTAGELKDLGTGLAGHTLFSPSIGIDDPVAYVVERLGPPAKSHVGVLTFLAGHVRKYGIPATSGGEERPVDQKKRRSAKDTVTALLEEAYGRSEKNLSAAIRYAAALQATAPKKALNILLEPADTFNGRTRRSTMLSALILNPKVGVDNVAATIAAKLAGDDRKELRAAVYRHTAKRAASQDKEKLAAELYIPAYHEGGRPHSLVKPYIGTLLDAGNSVEAARELESLAQSGYHTLWAFQKLSAAYGEMDRGDEARLRAVSSETEIFPKDVQPRVNLAHFYEQIGDGTQALRQYAEAVRIKPEDPYFYHLVIERSIRNRSYDVAQEMLQTMRKQLPRFQKHMNPAEKNLARDLPVYLSLEKRDPNRVTLEKKFRAHFVNDLAVVMSWDTQGTDMDLHVTDPSGEKCYYKHKATKAGGKLDHDDRDGLGPETFSIKRAPRGRYKVEVVYYNSSGPRTSVTVIVYRNRNGDNETSQQFVIDLTPKIKRSTVTTMTIGAGEVRPPTKGAFTLPAIHGKRDWGPEQATGAPDTNEAGDIETAWASLERDRGPEWLQLEYEKAVEIASLRIHETFNPGAVIKVDAVSDDGTRTAIWQGDDATKEAPAFLTITPATPVKARMIQIYLDTKRVAGWNEIDAVELIGADGSRQWASRAVASSTWAEQGKN